MKVKKGIVSVFAALTIIINVLTASVGGAGGINTIPAVNRGIYRLYGSSASSYYFDVGATTMSALIYDLQGYPLTISVLYGLIDYDLLTSSGTQYLVARYNQYEQYYSLGGNHYTVPTSVYILCEYVQNPKTIAVPTNSHGNNPYIKM